MAVLKIKDANGVWQTVQTLLGNAGGGTGDAIPKVGNRGVLAGYNTLNFLVNPTETVVINGTTNDDTGVMCEGGTVNVAFEAGGSETWCKHVLLYNYGGTVTLEVNANTIFDTASPVYSLGALDLLVYVWYGDMQSGIIYTKNIM